jgi:hypothetical protein
MTVRPAAVLHQISLKLCVAKAAEGQGSASQRNKYCLQGLDDAAMMEWVSALTEEPNMAALLEPIVAHNAVRDFGDRQTGTEVVMVDMYHPFLISQARLTCRSCLTVQLCSHAGYTQHLASKRSRGSGER